jgi:hypothetical protein
MHSVCKQLYVRNTPVNVFMNRVDPDVVLSLCNAALPPSDLLLFNPREESPKFLRQWLSYRGVLASVDDNFLAQQATADMHAKHNSPSITGFVDFDVRDASDDFLRVWMSWFGLGSKQKRSRRWWEKHAKRAQNLRKSVKGQAESRVQWSALVEMQRKIDQMVNFVVCSGAVLAQESWAEEVGGKEDEIENNEEEDAVFAKYADEPVKKLKKKNRKKWKRHERKLEAMSYASQIDAKKILAGLMNVGFVALPIFYQQAKTDEKGTIIEPGKFTLDKPTALKKEISNYYEELQKYQVAEGDSKRPAHFKEKVGKMIDDVRVRTDPVISQELLKIGLDAGGVPNAYALSVLGKQFIESGGITNTKQIARGVDNSTETLAAQLVTGLITKEKVDKPSTAEQIAKLLKNSQ